MLTALKGKVMKKLKKARFLYNFVTIAGVILSICVISIFLSQVFAAHSAEIYKPRKILLGTFKMNKTGFSKNDSCSYGVDWDMIRTSHVSVANDHSIFILDRRSKRVLQFDPSGNKVREVLLQDADFSDKSDELGDDGYIPYQLYVSSRGHRLYTSGGGKADNWTIYNLSGQPIRKNVRIKRLNKTCYGSFVANDGRQYLNESLEFTKQGLSPGNRDIAGNIISVVLQRKNGSKTLITKKTREGHEIWKKDLTNYSVIGQIIGLDGEGNIYLLVNARKKILKLNKNGKTLGVITFPPDRFFMDGSFISFQVICDGTIYVVPDYFAIWHSNKGNETKSYWLYEFSQR